MQRSKPMLGLALCLLSAAAAARVAVLPAPADSARRVASTATLQAPFPFTAIGTHWRSDRAGESEPWLYLSTSADGVVWSPWVAIASDPHMVPERTLPDGKANPHFGAIVGQLYFRVSGDARFLRYRLAAKAESTAGKRAIIEDLGFTVIDSRAPYVSREYRAAKRSIDQNYPKPPVVGRTEWGAAPPTCSYTYCNTTHVGVHHTAGVGEYFCDGFDECATAVRAIQTLHMNTNGWCDVGYNYLATPDGTLWEGRGGGDDVRGAHDGHNCGSMGVANLGYFHPPFNHLWTDSQQDSVAELSAWKSNAQGIDPLGADFYAGLGANMNNVYGHRDVSATACPGDNIYAFLPDLRSRTQDKLVNGPREWIFNNADADAVTSNWLVGSSAPDSYGADYLWTSTGSGEQCAWRVDVVAPGLYEVALWWPAGANRNPATSAFVKRPQPTPAVTVNQQLDGGRWNAIGTFSFAQGEVTIGVTNDGAPGYVVICDAIRLTARH